MIDIIYPIIDDTPQNSVVQFIPGRQLGKLLAAAVINKPFCELLLKDAGQAISPGFQGESFLLTKTELDVVLSIRAGSIKEFACQLNKARILSRDYAPIPDSVPCDPEPVDFFAEVSQQTGLD